MNFTKTDSELVEEWTNSTGIVLIYQTTTKTQLDELWNKWQRMSTKKKKISDEKSIELFGMTNEQHHVVLDLLYI